VAIDVIAQIEGPGRASSAAALAAKGHWVANVRVARGRVLVVEDEEIIREALGLLLDAEGYDVLFAENGREALRCLYNNSAAEIIVLDLRMPVMDGWEFRAIQKDDPKLSGIPVVAISADGSAQAAAISAEAYLRKPVDPKEFLATIERVLFEKKRRMAAQMDETERFAALGRLAAGVGHEINNPLSFVMLNLAHSIEKLRPALRPGAAPSQAPQPESDLVDIHARVADVTEMLEDCQLGSERIREIVSSLQRLSGHGDDHRCVLDIHKLIEESVAMVWNQIRHRARLIKTFGKLPTTTGNTTTLGQVFLNLLVNAAQAIPEGSAERNEIRISSRVQAGKRGAEIVVEISDSGAGMPPEVLAHVFEPFFTTKPSGQGTGLGLSISRQTIIDHGGRMTVDSEVGKGSVFRVFLPLGSSPAATDSVPALTSQAPLSRRRILVIDDEPLIGSIIQRALSGDHDVVVVQRAADALTLLEGGQTFDLLLCDVMMPDLSGPQFHEAISRDWPQMTGRLVFMTGGAFTPGTVDFVEHAPTRVLLKPFSIDRLKGLIGELLVDSH
jgi:two-component system cell cycle sensor histidine kinase/response regulator CckA